MYGGARKEKRRCTRKRKQCVGSYMGHLKGGSLHVWGRTEREEEMHEEKEAMCGLIHGASNRREPSCMEMHGKKRCTRKKEMHEEKEAMCGLIHWASKRREPSCMVHGKRRGDARGKGVC